MQKAKLLFSILLLLQFQSYLKSQSILNMQNGKFRICNGDFLDSDAGKNKGYYDHGENYILTLSMPGATSIQLDFQSFCTEIDADVLSIFDGKDTNSTLLGRYSGSVNPGKVSSTDSFLTIHFISDQSVSCTGWNAKIINSIKTPSSVKFRLNQGLNCNDSIIKLELDQFVDCDSLNINNVFINGIKINNIKPINCTNGKSKVFDITYNSLSSNGVYKISHTHGYRDYCDSVYFLSSELSFTVSNCPIILDLKASSDTICLGDCISFATNATGGNSQNYKYTWSHNQLKGSSPSFCPKKSIRISLKVEDGNALPGYDTVDIIVLDPPKVPGDTQVCYDGGMFDLKAEPAGGKWFGRGIINQQKGTFNPRIAWGNNKVWYQIGSCADTMNVQVTRPYNYENVFCPGTTAYPVYWYGPTGGEWSGPKITPTGFFLPDTPGIYKVSYTWKGCVSNKEIRVEEIDVPPVDTTCESSVRDTLVFSPKGLIVNYFKGLINAYWGWYNPSQMGGPGNYNVIYRGRGTCRDTTVVTVLPCFAGFDETVCPNQGEFSLSNWRKTNDALWYGKGIVDPVKGIYNPSWSKGMNGIDTVYLRSKHCEDIKIVKVLNTDIKEDTVSICPNTLSLKLSDFQVSVSGGTWIGPEIYSSDTFLTNRLFPGLHKLTYTQNTCVDSVFVKVHDFVILPSDTLVCANSEPLRIKARENGFFWGNGVYLDTQDYKINIKTINQDSVRVYFTNSNLCDSSFVVDLQQPELIDFSETQNTFCFRDTFIKPKIYPIGGWYGYQGRIDSIINPKFLGSGNHTIHYRFEDGICAVLDSWELTVLNPIRSKITPDFDSVCYGNATTLLASAFGGIGNFQYRWSHNPKGPKTSFTPQSTQKIYVYVSDGCSDEAISEAEVFVHPKVWFNAIVSDSVCYGLDGYIELNLRNGDPGNFIWTYPGKIINNRFYAPSGNDYKVFVTDLKSGCFGDTSIHIPGFSAVKAVLNLVPPTSGGCYSFLDSTIQVYNNSNGVSNGSIWLNSNFVSNIDRALNISNQDLNENNRILLKVKNDAGCSDSTFIDCCFNDTVYVFMPNAFSPDGNIINDVWEWNLVGASESEIAIYDRWGACLFKSNNSRGSWDGTYMGNPCQEGVYVVTAVYKSNKTFKRKHMQTILILRNTQ